MECYLSIDTNNINQVCDVQDVQTLTPLNANTKFDVTYNHIPFESTQNDINTNNMNNKHNVLLSDIESVSTSHKSMKNNNNNNNNKRRFKKRKNHKHSICIDMSVDKNLPEIPDTNGNNNNNNNNNNNDNGNGNDNDNDDDNDDNKDKYKHKNMSFELKNCSFNYGVFTTMMPLTYYNVSNIIPKKRPKYKLTRKVNKAQNSKKYVLCQDFVKIGVCYLGNKCKYSHNIYHNSKKKRVTNYKCSPCVEPARGIKCHYGNKCNFTHPGQELRRPMPISYQDKLYYSLLLRDQQIYRYPFGIFM